MFKIEDGREHFYQWDLDRKLIISDPTVVEVHFCNRTDDCSLVCETYVEDGITKVNVPNILLQTDWKIHVYAYDGLHTKHEKCYDVHKRSKPSDYAYTETEILNWSKIEAKVNDALAEIEEVEEVATLVLKNATDATGNAIEAANRAEEVANNAFEAEEVRETTYNALVTKTLEVNAVAEKTLGDAETTLADANNATDNANAAAKAANDAAGDASAKASIANDAAKAASKATANANEAAQLCQTTANDVESTLAEMGGIMQEAQAAVDNANNAAGEAYDAAEEANNAIAGMNNTFANVLKGSASDSFVSLGDVSPVPHTVKTNVHSKNLFNINDVYRAAYFDYRVEENKLILKKTNTYAVYSNIYFGLGNYKKFKGKTITISLTNESNYGFTGYVGFYDNDSWNQINKGFVIKANSTVSATYILPEEYTELPLLFRIGGSNNAPATDDEYTLSNIQVEYGTQATEYKPYVDIADTTIKACGKNLFNAYDLSYTSQGNRCIAETLGEGAIRVSVNKSADFMNTNVFLMKTSELRAGLVLYANSNVIKGDEGNTPSLGIYAYNSVTKQGKTLFSNKEVNGKVRCAVTLKDEHLTDYDEIRLLFYYNASTTTGWQAGDYVEFTNIMIEVGESGSETPYQPYQEKVEYTPDENGNVDIASISPYMTIVTDQADVVINAEYNKDINKAFAELQQAIISLGGNI